MEQDESLKSELRNLAQLQEQQIQILQAMRSDEQLYQNMTQMTNKQGAVNFDSASMYAASSEYMPKSSVDYKPQLISPYAQEMNQKFSQSLDSLKKGNGAYGFTDIISPKSTYSSMSRTLMNMDYSSRLSQATIAGATALGSTATSFGIGAILPGMVGLGVGVGGGAIFGIYADKANEEIQKNSALKKYIYKNSGRFIDSFESNNDRGITGFSREESADAANFIRTMNDEFYMSDDDTMLLLQKFTEGGLLKDAKDLDSFKDKMTTLTKTVKEGALMLNETYDSIADLMAEMKKAGIDQKDFKNIAGIGNVLAGLTGGDGGEIIRNFIDFIKNLNSGTPLDNNKSLSRLENTAVYISEYYNKLRDKYNDDSKEMTVQEKNNKNMIENLGGAEQASQYVMATIDKMADNQPMMHAGLMYFDWDQSQQDFVFNENKFRQYLKADHSLQEISENASRKLNELIQSGQDDAVLKWEGSYSTYIKNAMDEGDLTDSVRRAVRDYTNDSQLRGAGFDQRTILRKYFGVDDTGTQDLLAGFFDFKGDNPNLERDVKLQSMWQQTTASLFANAPSLSERFSSWGENIWDNITQGAVNFDNWLGKKFQDVTDKINGVDRVDPRYDRTLKTHSDLESISYTDVVNSINQSNKTIATTTNTLSNLAKKGYTIDSDLSDYVKQKFDSIDTTVTYDRDIISDWSNISKDLQDVKQNIMDTAEKNDLSEVIVAALNKYNQTKPDKEKFNIDTTSGKLKDEVFNYGGNYQIALAVAAAGAKREDMDTALKSAGYNMDELRQVGGQTAVKDIKISDLNVSDEIKLKVEEILKQDLTGNISTGGYGDKINNAFSAGGNSSAESINKILRGSLSGQGQMFVDLGRKWGIDPALVAAISMQETGGNSDALNNHNNPAGIMDWTSKDSKKIKDFNTLSEGFDFVFKNLKENYIDQGLTTIEQIQKKYAPINAANDPGGLNNQWTPGVTYFYKQATDGVDEGQNWTNEGSGSKEGNTYTSVQTTKKKVRKNVDGTDATQEQQSQMVFDSVKDSYLYQSNNTAYEKMKVLDIRNQEGAVWRTTEDRAQDIDNAIQKLGKPSIFNGKDSDPTGHKKLAVKEYLDLINEGISQGRFQSLNDALNDGTITERREEIADIFGGTDTSKEIWQNELSKLEQTEYVSASAKANSLDNATHNKFAMLEQFGRVRGIRKEDYYSDIGTYNELLNKQAQTEYDNIKQMMSDVSEELDTEASKKFNSMNAGEKRSLINLAKELSYVVEDTDEWNVNKMLEVYGEESFQSKEDNERLNHLKLDGAKGWVYDENYDYRTQDSNGKRQAKATWSDYDQWVKDGEQVDKISIGKSIFNSIDGISKIESSESTSSMKVKVEQQITDLIEQNNEKTRQLTGEVKSIINGTTSNSDINALNAGQRQSLADALSSKDTDKIAAVAKDLKLDNGVIESYQALADAINGMDVTSLKEFQEALTEIEERASDVSKLTTTLVSQMGDSFKVNLEKNMGEVMASSFDSDSQIYKALADKNGNFDYDKLAAALNTGQYKDEEGKTVDFSAESLDQLTAAMSKSVSLAMENTLSEKDGVEKLKSTAQYQAMEKDDKEELNKVLDKVSTLAEQIAEAGEKGYYTDVNSETGEVQKIEVDTQGIEDLKSQQKEMIDQATELYQESLQDLAKNQQDEVDALNNASKAAETATTTAKAFETAMNQYDSALNNAIKTLDKRVDGLDSKVSILSVASSWFGGGSGGSTVT